MASMGEDFCSFAVSRTDSLVCDRSIDCSLISLRKFTLRRVRPVEQTIVFCPYGHLPCAGYEW